LYLNEYIIVGIGYTKTRQKHVGISLIEKEYDMDNKNNKNHDKKCTDKYE